MNSNSANSDGNHVNSNDVSVLENVHQNLQKILVHLLTSLNAQGMCHIDTWWGVKCGSPQKQFNAIEKKITTSITVAKEAEKNLLEEFQKIQMRCIMMCLNNNTISHSQVIDACIVDLRVFAHALMTNLDKIQIISVDTCDFFTKLLSKGVMTHTDEDRTLNKFLELYDKLKKPSEHYALFYKVILQSIDLFCEIQMSILSQRIVSMEISDQN